MKSLALFSLLSLASISSSFALGAYDFRLMTRNSTNTANINADLATSATVYQTAIINPSTRLPEMFTIGSKLSTSGNVLNVFGLTTSDISGLGSAATQSSNYRT